MPATTAALVLVLLLAGCAWPTAQQVQAGRMCERFLFREFHRVENSLAEGHRFLAKKDFERATASFTTSFQVAEAGRYACDHGEEGSLNRNWARNLEFFKSTALRSLGDSYFQQRKFEQAEVHYKRALEMREQIGGPGRLSVADVLNDLGLLYRRQQRYEEALPVLERAVRIFEETPTRALDLAVALNNIGHVRDGQGRLAEAESFFARALQQTEAVKPPPEPRGSLQQLLHLKEYAAALTKSGKPEEAGRVEKRMGDTVRRIEEEIARLRGLDDRKADYIETHLRKILTGEAGEIDSKESDNPRTATAENLT